MPLKVTGIFLRKKVAYSVGGERISHTEVINDIIDSICQVEFMHQRKV